MTSPSQYRQYARECMQSAAKAQTEVERKTYLDMAWTWQNAALALDERDRSTPLLMKTRTA
jgi:hypothetical protein